MCMVLLWKYKCSKTSFLIFFIHRAVKASHVLISSDGRVCLTGIRYCYSLWNGCHRSRVVHNFPTHAVAVLPWVAPEILDQVGFRQLPMV